MLHCFMSQESSDAWVLAFVVVFGMLHMKSSRNDWKRNMIWTFITTGADGGMSG